MEVMCFLQSCFSELEKSSIFMSKERKPDLGNVSRGSHSGCSALCSSAVRDAVLDVIYYSNLCEVDVVPGLRLAKVFSDNLLSSE